MEILHRLGRATAAEVRAEMADPPSDAAVRSVLRVLQEKGHIVHHADGHRFVFAPRISAKAARLGAIDGIVRTFFDGSTEGAMAALLERSGPLSPETKRALKNLIDRAAEEGR